MTSRNPCNCDDLSATCTSPICHFDSWRNMSREPSSLLRRLAVVMLTIMIADGDDDDDEDKDEDNDDDDEEEDDDDDGDDDDGDDDDDDEEEDEEMEAEEEEEDDDFQNVAGTVQFCKRNASICNVQMIISTCRCTYVPFHLQASSFRKP